jgi:hypothetical protein
VTPGGVVFDAKKKDEDQKTINDIIKRSMTNKYEEDMNRDEEHDEYIPTMKEKFLKS